MKKISAYLPAAPGENVTISVRVNARLKSRVEKILQLKTVAKRKIGWQQLIEACLKRYCDEEEKG